MAAVTHAHTQAMAAQAVIELRQVPDALPGSVVS
jgi:hypothetical protein